MTSIEFATTQDDKGKKVYQPTVFQMGFQRTDVALMSPKLRSGRNRAVLACPGLAVISCPIAL